MEYRIGKCTLDIDVEATRAMYEAMPDPDITCSQELNFLRYLSCNEGILSFFQTLGIDPRKIAQHPISEVDTNKQLALYFVSLPCCGKTDAPVDDQEWFEGWEENVEQIDFGLALSIFHPDENIYLTYETYVPWMLSKPIMPTRYELRYSFPDLDDVK